jgi:hypothetical protein
MCEAAAFQIPQRFGALLQRLVVVIDHLMQHALVVGIGCERHIQLHRLCGPLRDDTHRFGQRRVLVAQKFDRVTEAHTAAAHDPVDYRASGLARAETVPQVLLRRDHQRRLVIVMEGAQTQQVGAVPF